jgi:membrane fusion protein (multidrug efflux system)
MPTSFPRSVGGLDLDRPRWRSSAIVVAVVLLVAWSWWFFNSRIAVYAVSDDARLEVDRAPFPVEAPVGGRVVSSTLTIGKEVRAGETLVELDVRAQAFGVSEERARLSGLGPQIARLEAEIAEQQKSRSTEQAAAAAAKAEAKASYDEASAAAELAADNEERTSKLARDGLIGQAELIRAQSATKQRRAAAEALRLASARIDAEQQFKDTEHQIKIERLEREAASLRAQARTGAATVERLEHEGDLRRIVAPVSGILAEIATLGAGRVLQAGDAVATVVPSGALHVVAGFLPAEAFGRVQPGQTARLRLEGFPPAQYGSVHAVVSTVAREVRDGRVRVELALTEINTSVPMQHGLPGTIEVEVEQISPAALVLRAVGRRMDQHSASDLSSVR